MSSLARIDILVTDNRSKAKLEPLKHRQLSVVSCRNALPISHVVQTVIVDIVRRAVSEVKTSTAS